MTLFLLEIALQMHTRGMYGSKSVAHQLPINLRNIKIRLQKTVNDSIKNVAPFGYER